MYALNLLLFLFYYNVIATKFIGKYDKRICKKSSPDQSYLSCNHQIEEKLRSVADCDVETISPQNCHIYDVNEVFDPFDIPFAIQVYKFKDKVLCTVGLNITFPNPTWSRMNVQLENQLISKYKICRKFRLDYLVPLRIKNPIFWDCLPFSVDAIEENYYTLFLEDEKNSGGIYSFRIPSVRSYDIERTHISKWHVFFFLHQHYMESTGRLIVTLQPAPFSNISYAISLVECLERSHKCEHNSVMQTIYIYQDRIKEDNSSILTIELKKVTVPGTYAVTIQIRSKACEGERCAVSVSPTFELKRSYGVEIVLGLLAVIILICLLTFLFMRKLHLDFYRYIEGKAASIDSVLFVYHADTEELFLVIRLVSKIFEKLTVRPLLVDEHVGIKDPNDWTRYQLCHASKVLFFSPADHTRESATPIQHQWRCALRYFSGKGFLEEERDVSSRCAVVILPNSIPVAEGSELYGLRKFDLKKDLASIANWLHRNRFSDRLLFWRPIVREFSAELSSLDNYFSDPGEGRHSEVLEKFVVNGIGRSGRHDYRDKERFSEFGGDDPPSAGYRLKEISSSELDDPNNTNLEDKVRSEFDPLIPDVNCVGEDGERDEEPKSSASSDSEISETDVLNFAT